MDSLIRSYYSYIMSDVDKFPWDNLQNELRVCVVKFLPCKERARVARLSKNMKKACVEATTVFPKITTGILPEELGRPFCHLLNALRYGVYALGLAGCLSKRAKEIIKQDTALDRLFDLHMYEDLMSLNSNVFSYWDTDFSGKVNSGVYSYVRRIIELNPSMGITGKQLEQARHWPTSRIHGKFYILLNRPDGTVVISEDKQKVYLVQGILHAVAKVVVRAGDHLPVYGMGNFLPFFEYICFDGLFLGCPPAISAKLRRQLYGIYAAAVDSGNLITSLSLPVLPPAPLPTTGNGTGTKGTVPSSSGATDTPAPTPVISAQLQRHLQRVKDMQKNQNPTNTWIFRR